MKTRDALEQCYLKFSQNVRIIAEIKKKAELKQSVAFGNGLKNSVKKKKWEMRSCHYSISGGFSSAFTVRDLLTCLM